jgi:flagellar hook protein FlgE
MISAFSTALSGLNADSSAIDVVGNDLANLNT